jgi:hypothetical protein
MIENQSTNPFKIGDRVVFAPDGRSIGWDWPIFERVRLKPGDSGVITRIEKDVYLYLDDERGAFTGSAFRLRFQSELQGMPHRATSHIPIIPFYKSNRSRFLSSFFYCVLLATFLLCNRARLTELNGFVAQGSTIPPTLPQAL